tara:strand:+ start:209 stop:397 length:189 start_codon:yes stop_codon:yes gene_type:complete
MIYYITDCLNALDKAIKVRLLRDMLTKDVDDVSLTQHEYEVSRRKQLLKILRDECDRLLKEL